MGDRAGRLQPRRKAWQFITHDKARSKAYRWGEDGLAGLSDEGQYLALTVALWNEHDCILKERLFGLSGPEGNHGEDVKEFYHYVDATPTHSYLKMLYRYPQVAFPYEQLVTENRARSFEENEFELIDTGVFDDSAYFDLFVEVAKADPETLYLRIEAINRAARSAPLHLLPLVTFRNTWSWGVTNKPVLHALDHQTIEACHPVLGRYYWTAEEAQRLLFTENESNTQRLFGEGFPPQGRKDAFNRYLVEGYREAVHAESRGTRAAAHYYYHDVPAGGRVRLHMRLGKEPPGEAPFADTSILTKRREEADRFYEVVQEGISDEDERFVQRMAFAGLIWSKQLYYYDVERWLEGDPGQPPPPKERWRGRNSEWTHLCNFEVISMPDKWEYPWYASWDLAFHCLPFALIDPEFAKQQLVLLTREWYMHPNGQMPAYEWNFSDVNPPVHAWAAWRVFQIDRKQRGDAGDIAFLERLPPFKRRLQWTMENRPDLKALVSHWEVEGLGHRRLLSLLRGHRMKRLLFRMLDENEFLSPYGVCFLSKIYRDNPLEMELNGDRLTVEYQPAEAKSGMFGGNSNWRGPIWFPVNLLIVESLQKFHHYYGDDFKVECPTHSGRFLTLLEISEELTRRLRGLFAKDEHGLRPCNAIHPKYHQDPAFGDYPTFWEYFHGDNGRGVGAAHQTGWTALIAKLLKPRRRSETERPREAESIAAP